MIEIKLPDIGEGIAEGEVVQWHVSVGDDIQEEQLLLEILTDKASVEIPAPSSGKVSQILFSEGDLVPVGETIVVLNGADANASTPIQENNTTAPPKEASEPAPSQTSESIASLPAFSSDILATPSTRKLAREKEVDLNKIQGSGPYGRILKEDVLNYESVKTKKVSQILSVPKLPLERDLEEHIPLRGIRRKIADQMVKAKFTAPDFMFADEMDITELVEFRNEIKGQMKDKGVKMTYLPFVIKAVIAALKAYPTLNATLDDEAQKIILKKYYNIGFATASPHGLFVPVIHNADKMSLVELALEIERLAAAVRDGKATSQEMRGGTFTVTNIGAIGGLMSSPIINHPEVAILGVNKIYQKPMVYQGEIAIRWACPLSLSFDHRVVDGADGAYFTQHIMRLLENPKLLLLEP